MKKDRLRSLIRLLSRRGMVTSDGQLKQTSEFLFPEIQLDIFAFPI